MSFGGGSSGQIETITDREPWEQQQPHLKDIFGGAKQLYEDPGPDYYPGATTVPFAPETESAMGMRAERARIGSPLTQAAKGHVLETIAGAQPNRFLGGVESAALAGNPALAGLRATAGTGMANPELAGLRSAAGAVNPNLAGVRSTAAGGAANPFLDQLYERSARPIEESFRDVVAPSIAGRFLGAGRFGSGAMKDAYGRSTDALGRTLGDLSASIYAPAYEAERGRQVAAQARLANLGEASLERNLTTQAQLAGFGEAGLGRGLAAQGQLAGFGEAGLGRQYGAQSQLAGFGETALGRNLNVQAQLAGLGESGLGRRFGAQTQLAGLGETALGRRMAGQTQLAGFGESELGRRAAAAQYAPSLAGTDYGDIGNLEAVGRAREEYGQRQIGEAINRFEFEQQKPATKMAQYLQFIQGNYGGPITQTQPIFRNQVGGLLGGAATGAALGSYFGDMTNPQMLALMAGGGFLGAM